MNQFITFIIKYFQDNPQLAERLLTQLLDRVLTNPQLLDQLIQLLIQRFGTPSLASGTGTTVIAQPAAAHGAAQSVFGGPLPVGNPNA